MENIKDILSNLKERFANPFIFAFFSSWIIINWKIALSIIWHNESDIKAEGYTSIYKFIESNFTQEQMLCKPLWFAIGYTLLFPILKNLIRIFNSLINKWGEKLNLNVIGGAKISLDKYISLRENYLIKAKTLSNAFEKESQFLEDNRSLAETIVELNKKNDEYYKQLIENQKVATESKSSFVLDGRWQLSILDDIQMKMGGKVAIQNGNDWYSLGPNDEMILTHNIRDFIYDVNTTEAFFVIVPIRNLAQNMSELAPKTYRLKLYPDTMEGEENYVNKIFFTRIR
ncbi:MAG: hypothetical protein V4561_10050 [Bacteroidota bacterium]